VEVDDKYHYGIWAPLARNVHLNFNILQPNTNLR
jgi:hypothetical protein